jgi:hypothetical protein
MILAGIFNACMDVIDFHFDTSVFSKWTGNKWIDPSISWKNKWKNGDYTQGEKFLGSSTIFVFVTDLWHFLQFLMILAICFAIVVYHPLVVWWADILFLLAAYSITFEIFFSKILVKK